MTSKLIWINFIFTFIFFLNVNRFISIFFQLVYFDVWISWVSSFFLTLFLFLKIHPIQFNGLVGVHIIFFAWRKDSTVEFSNLEFEWRRHTINKISVWFANIQFNSIHFEHCVGCLFLFSNWNVREKKTQYVSVYVCVWVAMEMSGNQFVLAASGKKNTKWKKQNKNKKSFAEEIIESENHNN